VLDSARGILCINSAASTLYGVTCMGATDTRLLALPLYINIRVFLSALQ
jgi:hypothetical protein